MQNRILLIAVNPDHQPQNEFDTANALLYDYKNVYTVWGMGKEVDDHVNFFRDNPVFKSYCLQAGPHNFSSVMTAITKATGAEYRSECTGTTIPFTIAKENIPLLEEFIKQYTG